jgi:small redox-active disulfide protein 2
MEVKILGSGCSKCTALEQKVRQLDELHQLHLDIEKVTDLNVIISYRILTTPGLVINGKLRSVGAVPNNEQLLQWLREEDS